MKLRLSRTGALRVALLVAGTGAATSLVVGNDSQPEGAAVAVTAVRAKSPAAPATNRPLPTVDLEALSRPLGIAIADNLFHIQPPPAPPPQPASPPQRVVETPPPKPTAPALPFTFIGRLVDKGATTIFVGHNGQSLSLKQGDTAAGVYRVEQITESEIVFVYEPLAERQVLAMGAGR